MAESSDERRVLVTPDDLVGYEIDGRYRLDSILGGGGMGVVFRTTQQNLNREVAIKLLKIDERGTRRLDRFRREIDIIAQLTHPNIVRVFDSGQDPALGLHYIAMELVDGAPLDELMQGHRLTPELAVDIAYEVCAALTEPHRAGIVHRDIKPANVLLATRSDDTLAVKVVDFGIARTVSGTDSPNGKITTTGVVVGSPMYMAPEVARGESLDGRTDLYSLGVLLYEMITGDTPFRGSTPVAIMLRHAVDEPPSLADSVDDGFEVPELISLVDRMLSKERRDRPSDAKDVLRALDEIRQIHGFGRVRLDSDVPLLQSLNHHRVPVTLHVDDSLDESSGASPFDATTTMGSDVPQKTESDTFSGWLVSESARNSLADTHRNTAIVPANPPADEQLPEDIHPPVGRPNRTYLLIGSLLLAVGIAGVVVMFSDGATDDEAVELGGSNTTADAVVPQTVGGDSPSFAEPNEPTEPMVFAEPADAGAVSDDIGDEPGPDDIVPPSDSKKPTKRPKPNKNTAAKTNGGESDADKQVDEAMKWLKR